MKHGLLKSLLSIAIALALAAGLSACGRKGPLEAPGGSSVATPAPAGQTSEPVEEQQPDRRFILDGLI